MADNEEEIIGVGDEVDFNKEDGTETDEDIASEDSEPNMELSMREIE